jgi:hypothetical protein
MDSFIGKIKYITGPAEKVFFPMPPVKYYNFYPVNLNNSQGVNTMALFSEQEKDLLGQALHTYLQLLSQQLSEAQVSQVVPVAEAGGPPAGGKPKGISEEHFQKVCQTCEQLAPDGSCLDKITAKFPGKCDPILLYERNKAVKKT